MKARHGGQRRPLRRIAIALASGGLVATALVAPSTAAALAPVGESLRPVYHLTAPSDWLSDPQRPVWADGEYQFYYLWADREDELGGAWRHATTTDNVVFADQGVAIDKDHVEFFPVWTGSLVVDENNTAGFGAGTIVALATQPTDGDRYDQEQYLWYSTDDGYTFTPYGPPVIDNPGNNDWFRDPKIVWDDANGEWVAVIGLLQKMQFFTSPDLKNWTYQSEFAYTSPNIGGMECPDIFRIQADDDTWHWVLAASMQGDYSGKPNTLAYWIGDWDGQEFTPDQADPQWLDWGLDWYAAVTWPDEQSPDDRRFATGWMNNWRYADPDKAIPSDVADDISGQMSITREIVLADRGSGVYTLLSSPVAALADHVTRTVAVDDLTVDDDIVELDYRGVAYELETDISWTALQNVGIQVGVSADGTRHTDLGVYANEVFYLNRQGSEQPGQTPEIGFYPWVQSESAFDVNANSVHLRVFVDKGSVEVFVGDGEDVHSSQVFFAPGDTGIRFYTDGGAADFENTVIREFGDITTAADPAAAFEDFEGSGYGSWSTTGSAFGSGPATGTLPDQQPVAGYLGDRLVNSYLSGDSTTGTLTSPSFTIDEPFINFLVGGGRHPRPGDVFAGFEGSTWGSGWTATGSFSGQGPTAGSLTNQVGAQALDTYVNGGDPATGTITSPEFTITRDWIDLRLAGGNHPWGSAGATAINLVIDGVVHRTATGDDSGVLRDVAWDVHAFVGHTAQIVVIDEATGGWGHLMVDQIVFADEPGSIGSESSAATTIDLIVDGQVVRTATGWNDEYLRAESWLVDDLLGESATIRIVDANTGGWGHINIDQITFDDRPAT
jgi:sucrose-6-phosphate hydrolase SacC (GH32 family)